MFKHKLFFFLSTHILFSETINALKFRCADLVTRKHEISILKWTVTKYYNHDSSNNALKTSINLATGIENHKNSLKCHSIKLLLYYILY